MSDFPFLKLGENITIAPLVHESGDCALAVRHLMLQQKFSCLAVALPPSFKKSVEAGIELLPAVTVAVQMEETQWGTTKSGVKAKKHPRCSYVPIDPCQPVISALRTAHGERIPRYFIDLEQQQWRPNAMILPDPYALKKISLEHFAIGMLSEIPRPEETQHVQRLQWMGTRLRELAEQQTSVLFLCSLQEWPWIREAYLEQPVIDFENDEVEEPQLCAADENSLLFILGELPYITALYEQARSTLDDDENLSIDGIKSLLLQARTNYEQEAGPRARKITPSALSKYLVYVRNLSLIEHRLTPDMYTLIVAAQQFFGDQYAISLTDTIRQYPYAKPSHLPVFRKSSMKGEMPDGTVVLPESRLAGHIKFWRSSRLMAQPPKMDQMKWEKSWNPYGQCSWPPEDTVIERFRTHVQQAALQLLGNDLIKTEKFTTSLKDGLDMRDTLRHWHTGDLYVKEIPPHKGSLDCVIMLFDSPADPRDYPYRITWHAEHHDESTLSFFASDYHTNVIGPGIAQSTYGGALFLFPPRDVHNVWRDPRFDFVDTLEERLIVAGCFHSREKHVAILSALPPGRAWQGLAKKYGRKLIHIPLSRFSQETIANLRAFHVLNGQEIRSFAAHFIRKP